MRIFLAGIMQGSHLGAVMHYQGYREQLRELLQQHLPEVEVYDPLADHQLSLDYTDEMAREVFLNHNRMCGQVDVLIAFVPEASMGTAIEMWEAWRANRVVIAISPLTLNWTIKYCSHLVYVDLVSFQADLASGDLAAKIAAIQARFGTGTN
ncbi:hypothetical protein [Anatilimnocola floriformis]|uniref:hypothetical protein n=1 Tax=Anatilimnocola floriformis TaxID=2948575 RepID=UPI0020C21F1D|nr:hypothetical protein [Anatilimnocola floriformis]